MTDGSGLRLTEQMLARGRQVEPYAPAGRMVSFLAGLALVLVWLLMG